MPAVIADGVVGPAGMPAVVADGLPGCARTAGEGGGTGPLEHSKMPLVKRELLEYALNN